MMNLSFLDRFKGSSFFQLPEIEPQPEKVEELIEKIAQFVVKHGMEIPAIFTIETSKPLAYLGAQMGTFYLSAFFPLLPGNLGFDALGLLRERANLDKMIERIEELREEKEAKEKEIKEKRAREKPKDKRSLRLRAREFFKR